MANSRPDRHGFGGWSVTGVGTSSGVTVTHTMNTLAARCIVSGVQVSGDAAAVVTVESPSGTAIFKKRYTAAFGDTIHFPAGLVGTDGQNVLVKISASTTNCEANMQGWDAR